MGRGVKCRGVETGVWRRPLCTASIFSVKHGVGSSTDNHQEIGGMDNTLKENEGLRRKEHVRQAEKDNQETLRAQKKLEILKSWLYHSPATVISVVFTTPDKVKKRQVRAQTHLVYSFSFRWQIVRPLLGLQGGVKSMDLKRFMYNWHIT